MTLNFWPFCVHLLSVGILGMPQCWEWNQRPHKWYARTLCPLNCVLSAWTRMLCISRPVWGHYRWNSEWQRHCAALEADEKTWGTRLTLSLCSLWLPSQRAGARADLLESCQWAFILLLKSSFDFSTSQKLMGGASVKILMRPEAT